MDEWKGKRNFNKWIWHLYTAIAPTMATPIFCCFACMAQAAEGCELRVTWIALIKIRQLIFCNVSWRNARQYHHEEGQKKNFVLRQGHFGLRPVFGIFLSFRMMRNVVHSPMNYIFLPLASFFHFKK